MPRLTDLDYRTIRHLDDLVAGRPVEDSLVELKTIWPVDTWKAARQIAGHANASGGSDLLWIIGANEKAREVRGADHMDVDSWWKQIRSHFDEVAPTITHINVQYGEATVVAVLVNTERLPYVVKNKNGGGVDREVTWREGDSTRSATRSDLLRLLVPRQATPDFQVLSGELTAKNNDDSIDWTLFLYLYIKPRGDGQVVIPYHESEVQFTYPPMMRNIPIHGFRLTPRYNRPVPMGEYHQPPRIGIHTTLDEATIYSPCRATFYVLAAGRPDAIPDDISIQVSFLPVHANVPAIITATYVPMHETIADKDLDETFGKWLIRT